MSPYQYMDSHVKDESRDRLIFKMGIPYLWKTVFILRRGPAFLALVRLVHGMCVVIVKHTAAAVDFKHGN